MTPEYSFPVVPMLSFLPRVQHDTALVVMSDLLRNEESDDTVLLAEWAAQIWTENPEVLKAVNWLIQDADDDQKVLALGAMAITYRALSAQSEIEALKRMKAAPRKKQDWINLAQRIGAWVALIGIFAVILLLIAMEQ